jgi:hypothetical protein
MIDRAITVAWHVAFGTLLVLGAAGIMLWLWSPAAPTRESV